MKQAAIAIVIIVLLIGGFWLSRHPQTAPSANNTPSMTVFPTTATTNSPTDNNANNAGAAVPANTDQGLSLTVSTPANGSTVSGTNITVTGKTGANAEVFVSDQSIKADGQGNFSATITIDQGENVITVSANDSLGNYAEKEITVNVQ